MAEWRGVAPPERKSLTEQMGDDITFQEKQLMTAWVVSLNSGFEAFKDKRVRQAMNLCIDRHGGLPKLAKLHLLLQDHQVSYFMIRNLHFQMTSYIA